MRFLKLFAVGVAGVVTAILMLPVGSASGEVYAIPIPFGERSGVCSNGGVTSFSYTVVATPPGLYNVLAVSKRTYDALINADFNEPGLPSPLLDMSIQSPPRILIGARSFPANRKLLAQVMCLLLDNRAPSDAPPLVGLPVIATINLTWTYSAPPPPTTTVWETTTARR